MVTKSELNNNKILSGNPTAFKDEYAGLRALVVDRLVPGLEDVAVKDYYNIVVLETDAALPSVPVPDFLLLPDDSPYRESVLYIEQFFSDENTIYGTNYNAIDVYKKLKRSLTLFNFNWLKTAAGSSDTDPATARKTSSGLDRTEPGVHLSRIMGCTEIQYTGFSSNATHVTLDDIIAFTEEKEGFLLKNQVGIDRLTVLNTL